MASGRARNSVAVSVATQAAKKNDGGDMINGNNETKVGIGGAGGVSYNVNALKRNLVQETVRHSKEELWDLLESSTFSPLLEDRLAAIVQVNPVSCTTDSNMLDGEFWTFAFRSRQSAESLLDPTRFTYEHRKQELASSSRKKSNTGRSYVSTQTLTFNLEGVNDSEDPYVVDQLRMFGGLWEKTEIYSVVSLTRKSIGLQLRSRQWKFLGKKMKLREEGDLRDDDLTTRNLHILYLDSDLCIVSERGMDQPFRVFNTKGHSRASIRRKIRSVVSGVVSGQVQAAGKLGHLMLRLVWKPQPKPVAPIMTEGQALNLGGMEEDQEAWEGDEDPFLNLSADERQELIKRMKLSEVERAGKAQRTKAVTDRKNYKNLSPRQE